MRLPSELVTRHSLDPSLLPHGLQHFLLHQPLPQTEQPCSCAPLSTQRLPAALTPCFLPTWSPVLRCSYVERHPLSPREAPEMVVQPPTPQFTAHHSSSRRPQFTSLLLPAPPPSSSYGSPLLCPAHQHPPCPHLLIRPADSPQEASREGQRLICQAEPPGAWEPWGQQVRFSGWSKNAGG